MVISPEEKLAETILQLKTASDDPFAMTTADNPTVSLGPIVFDGDNYIAWSRQLRRTLGARLKIGFVDGTIKPPKAEDENFAKWQRCDRTVACWIFNSMTPELANSFVYNTTVSDLWLEIQERFSQTNASLRYQLKLESMRILQGNSSVTVYYGKLKKCWDDLACMQAIPVCSCGAMQTCKCKVLTRIQELESEEKLLHFLVNLNTEYDQVKNHILTLDPLPTLGRAYYMVLQVEKQKGLQATAFEPAAFMAGELQGASSGGSQPKKDFKKGNSGKHCSVCNMNGHSSDTCFEVIGYPDWYKGKKKNRNGKVAGNASTEKTICDTPLSAGEGTSSAGTVNIDPGFVAALYQELMKISKGKQQANFASVDFAGPYD